MKVGGFTLSWQLLAMFMFALVVAVVLFVFMAKTRTGMSMRAVAQDPVGARIVGIPLFRVFAITFGISTLLVRGRGHSSRAALLHHAVGGGPSWSRLSSSSSPGDWVA